MKTSYLTIQQASEAEFKDRGSRFLAYAFPVSSLLEIKKHISTLKLMHPKAVHYCLAWRLGHEGAHYRVIDDGEPVGSAGRPILGQIDSMQLTNVLVVVVRYFGGTLLGVPGLIQAYKTATHEALQKAILIEKLITKSFLIRFDYPQMNEVIKYIHTLKAEIAQREMALFCEWKIEVPLETLALLNTPPYALQIEIVALETSQ